MQIDVFESGNWNDTDTIVSAYKNGDFLGSLNAGAPTANGTLFSFDLSQSSLFADVDEIRISRPNGSTGATVEIDKLIIEGSLPENNDPVISGISGSALTIAPGKNVKWPSVTISDEDDDPLTVTIASTGVTVSGLTDEDTSKEGIQLTGSATEINSLLAGATFSAAEKGSASIEISVDDGRVSDTITGTISLDVKTPSSGGGGGTKPKPEPNIVHTDDDGRAVATDESETFVREDDANDAVTLSGSREDYTITRSPSRVDRAGCHV